jgi:hypothetical protein
MAIMKTLLSFVPLLVLSTGCVRHVYRIDFGYFGGSCSVSKEDLDSEVDPSATRYLSDHLHWPDTSFGRVQSAIECCAPDGKFIGWQWTPEGQVSPLCAVGAGKDKMFMYSERANAPGEPVGAPVGPITPQNN